MPSTLSIYNGRPKNSDTLVHQLYSNTSTNNATKWSFCWCKKLNKMREMKHTLNWGVD